LELAGEEELGIPPHWDMPRVHVAIQCQGGGDFSDAETDPGEADFLAGDAREWAGNGPGMGRERPGLP